MALKKKVTKTEYDALNPIVQGEYTVNPADADSYELDVDGLEDVGGLKTALDKERKRANDAEKEAKKFQGLDPEAARVALAAQQKAEEDRLKAEGNFNALRDQLVQKHDQEKQALAAQLQRKDQAVAKLLIENVARDELAKAKVKGTGKAVMPQILSSTKTEYDETTGEYRVVVVDAKGNPRIANGRGDAMTIAELVAELKADSEFGVNFEPSGTSGGGQQQQRSTQTNLGVKQISRSDTAAMSANLADIANGKVVVVD